jgi:hypothetical protein
VQENRVQPSCARRQARRLVDSDYWLKLSGPVHVTASQVVLVWWLNFYQSPPQYSHYYPVLHNTVSWCPLCIPSSYSTGNFKFVIYTQGCTIWSGAVFEAKHASRILHCRPGKNISSHDRSRKIPLGHFQVPSARSILAQTELQIEKLVAEMQSTEPTKEAELRVTFWLTACL